MKNRAGFTLLELLLAILCAAVVAVAALSLLHVGIRMGGICWHTWRNGSRCRRR